MARKKKEKPATVSEWPAPVVKEFGGRPDGRLRLKGKLTVCRTFGGASRLPISIELIDDSSGCRLVEIEVGLAQFAEALTGMGRIDCVYEYFPACPAGHVREHKTEEVTFLDGGIDRSERDSAIRLAVSMFEKDGWKGDDEDCRNMHRHVRGGQGTRTHTVRFNRFVAPKE